MNKWLDTKLFEFQGFHLVIGSLMLAASIIAANWLILYLLNRQLMRRVKQKHIERSSAYAVIQILKYIFWTAAILLALQALGINVSILLAGSAALLVGLGFGLQQTFSDFVSGIILLLDSAIKIDDVLEFDGMVCKVSKIGVRTSTVINRDDVYIIVPNSKFTSDKVINWTHSGQLARFHIHVTVAYNSDIELVKRCLLESAASENEICKTPEPMVSLKSFDDSGISFGLYFWSHEIFRVERICSDLRTQILLQFRKNGIEIPYPKMDINIKENHLPTPL